MKFYLFVDETHLLYADKNLKSLESTINDELRKPFDQGRSQDFSKGGSHCVESYKKGFVAMAKISSWHFRHLF